MNGAYQKYLERKINYYAVLVRKCNCNNIVEISGADILACRHNAGKGQALLIAVAGIIECRSTVAVVPACCVSCAGRTVDADLGLLPGGVMVAEHECSALDTAC